MNESGALSTEERAAVQALLRVAQTDTGQARRVAGFLLSWWNAENCGGFDLTDLWAVDRDIAEKMLVVFAMVARVRAYPDALGWKADFEKLVAAWRPALVEGAR